jgi:hypothetical protein
MMGRVHKSGVETHLAFGALASSMESTGWYGEGGASFATPLGV